jgi:hypothetical protein
MVTDNSPLYETGVKLAYSTEKFNLESTISYPII